LVMPFSCLAVLRARNLLDMTSAGLQPGDPLPTRGARCSAPLAVALRDSVRLAFRWIAPSATCLHRALAFRRLCRMFRIACIVRIGVRCSEAEVEAHAWVEV